LVLLAEPECGKKQSKNSAQRLPLRSRLEGSKSPGLIAAGPKKKQKKKKIDKVPTQSFMASPKASHLRIVESETILVMCFHYQSVNLLSETRDNAWCTGHSISCY
jgi:hypothetical protein